MKLSLDIQQDNEANEFANCLLMPKEMIEQYYNSLILEMDITKVAREMAKIFKVDIVRMSIRLKDLNLI